MFLTAALLIGAVGVWSCASDDDYPATIKPSDLPALPKTSAQNGFPRGDDLKPRDLTLALVGEVRGELEPCGCPTLPYGGFERRHTQLDRLRSDSTIPVFHIDLGDTLVKGIATARGDELSARAKEMLRLSRMVGVDLWVPGPSDLVALSPTQIASTRDIPMTSATWINPKTQKTLLPSFAVIERANLRIGVIGLSAEPSGQHEIQYRNPTDAVNATLPLMPTDLDWIIGAGTVADDNARSLTAIDGLSAVFTTRGESYSDPPQGRAQRVVIETPDRGRYLQVVHVRLGSTASSPLYLHPDPPEWRARLSAIRRGENDALNSEGEGRNLGLVNTIPLSGDLDREGVVAERLDTYRIERINRAAKNAATPPERGPHYVSSGSCVNCHSDEFARWTLTGHARAWRVLIERRETENPECIGCHTTGYGQPGGFGELTTTNIRKFKGVQCEMCHGPMGGHPSDKRVKSPTITEATCTGCHDEANSPKFNYSTYLAQASCQGGAPELIPRPAEQ